MTGAALQAAMTKQLRQLLADENCPLPLTYVSDIGLTRNGVEYFTVSDANYDYTISVQFEDPR